jgi:Glyoxalase-like domain
VTSRLWEIVVDSHDPKRLAEFWCEVLGYRVLEEEEVLVEIGSAAPTREEARAAPVIPTLIFLRVPESKAVKNRLHLDVTPFDHTREEEVERLLALGATRADVGQSPDASWTVLADPEGNEFCVLRDVTESRTEPFGN